MKTDGLIPIAFAEKDGWPALGTFDILNLRINGYDYHIKLMKHEVPWTDPGVDRGLQPVARADAVLPERRQRPDLAGRRQGAGEQAGRHDVPGLQPGRRELRPRRTCRTWTSSSSRRSTRRTAPTTWTRPTDGFMLPKKGKNPDAAKTVLEYIGTGDAETDFLKTDHWDVGLANGLVAPTYNDIQKKSVAEIAKCKNVSQFMDRDTVPDMANAMIKVDPELHRQPDRRQHRIASRRAPKTRRRRSSPADGRR